MPSNVRVGVLNQLAVVFEAPRARGRAAAADLGAYSSVKTAINGVKTAVNCVKTASNRVKAGLNWVKLQKRTASNCVKTADLGAFSLRVGCFLHKHSALLLSW